MSLMNTSKFIKLVYSYLGYKHILRSDEIDKQIEECLDEVIKLAQFNYIYVEFDYLLDFLKEHKAYKKLLENTTSYYLVLMTLGKRIDDRCKYYSMVDLTKMVIFDAVSSAYLEYMSDEYEELNFKKPRTYRFCPGYQGTETKDIREIFKYLDNEKIGVSLLESNLMVPMKTMAGIIGFGKTNKKECGACTLLGECEYRKDGRKCYSED